MDGTEYKYWRHQLADLTDEKLLAGLRATRNCGVEAYKLTWSDFRRLCVEATRQEPSHRKFQALPVLPASKEFAKAQCEALKKLLAD